MSPVTRRRAIRKGIPLLDRKRESISELNGLLDALKKRSPILIYNNGSIWWPHAMRLVEQGMVRKLHKSWHATYGEGAYFTIKK